MSQVFIARSSQTPYPPIGTYAYPMPVMTFQPMVDNFKPMRLRPVAMRSPQAESSILGRMKSIANGLSRQGDVENL